MRPNQIIASTIFLILTSCINPSLKYTQPLSTQMQVREVQTRTFDHCDVKTVMKAMINVLQDEGFIVKNAVLELGLLTAEKDINVESRGSKFFSILKHSRKLKHAILEVSINVTDFGHRTKVRVNFQMKTFDNQGAVTEIKQVMDDIDYQNFFSKVSKSIFLQHENL